MRFAGSYLALLIAVPFSVFACGSDSDSDDDDSGGGATTSTSGGNTAATGAPSATTGSATSAANTSGSNGGGTQGAGGVSATSATSSAASDDTSAATDSSSSDGDTSATSAGGAPGTTSTGAVLDGIGGGVSTDCEDQTPVDGESCDSEGTVCGLGEGEEVCACFDAGDGAEWTCFAPGAGDATTAADFGGFGGGFGTASTGM